MAYPTLKVNSERLKRDFDALAEIGATVGGGVSRLALSNEDLEARAWFAERIEDAGLTLRDDDVGNLSGVLSSTQRKAKTLLIGSHLDTPPNGGRYDGSIGILAGLECVRVLKAAEVRLPFHLEVIDFTDEEGNWRSLFGSRGVAGLLQQETITDQQDSAFHAALYRAGIHPGEIHKARRDPDTLLGYIELHIEQGYKLDRDQIEIGIVSAIVGRTTYELTFIGEGSHSGTTEISKRRDALQGAAAFILRAHGQLPDLYPGGVFNCGNIRVRPGAFNIIPAEAILTVECRHAQKYVLDEMERSLLKLAEDYAAQYQLELKGEKIAHMPAAVMDETIQRSIELACKKLSLSYRKLVSYAGHDAQMLSTIIPSGMIFIPSVGGISHNPKEFTHWHHVEKGANTLLETILVLARETNGRK